jgi:hypothetical protein
MENTCRSPFLDLALIDEDWSFSSRETRGRLSAIAARQGHRSPPLATGRFWPDPGRSTRRARMTATSPGTCLEPGGNASRRAMRPDRVHAAQACPMDGCSILCKVPLRIDGAHMVRCTGACLHADVRVEATGQPCRSDQQRECCICPRCGYSVFGRTGDGIEVNPGSLDTALLPPHELWSVRREAWMPPFTLRTRYELDRDSPDRFEG